MKKILILIFSIVLFISCNVNNTYKQEQGIVKTIEILQRYDPVIHMNKDIYKMGVQFEDTIIYIVTDWQPTIGDTITIYGRIPKEELPLDDYEM